MDPMTLIRMLGDGLFDAFSMFWETLWALFLGFALSGAIQAFVSRARMQRALGDHRPATLAKATVWGMVSSSCSYAASALAKTLFRRGADFTTSLVFMIASTNLVIELGLVLWLLLGWQFALAELVGGAIMIALLGLVGPRVLGGRMADEARVHLDRFESASAGGGGHEHHHDHGDAAHDEVPLRRRLRSREGWADAAGYMISDLTMIRKELVIGFVVAGFITVLVPDAVWQSLFATGHGFWSSLENVIVGPFLAIISFVCSVGNVPLAATLWHGGASFGGVVAFVFADLIALPLLVIYRRYFGTRVTLRILVVFWATMSAAGLAVEYLFKLVRIPEPAPIHTMTGHGPSWDHTTWLNLAALVLFAVMYWLYRTARSTGKYAKDPMCGMQVEIANAPARRVRDGEAFYFCSDRCARQFDERTPRMTMSHDPSGTHRDPVCGMTVSPETAVGSVEHEGETYYFCSTGCRTAFGLKPEAFLAPQ
ncbi:YHS domain-containing protein [Gryllotalpicola protaetiae]|uniref:YHS domain-containing protein n=2 Tax=Gryllotalpicola protaetiae TaxID=2419771 RepID=A0A387BKP6_9MICO|nr:YHS domain-containing protein [Gryllotalpicola protaetiae]